MPLSRSRDAPLAPSEVPSHAALLEGSRISTRDRRCARRRSQTYPMGIVAEAVHTLQEVTSPSSQLPSVPTMNSATAFPSTNETEK